MRIGRLGLIGLIASPCFANNVDSRQVSEKLDAHPEVLVNSQGLAQHDLSIQGSSYTGAGLAINGLRLKNPWSAHYNSELPVIGNLLSAPCIGTGLDTVSGHLTGTADFTTQPVGPSSVYKAGVGTKEHYAATAYTTSENLGAYIDWEKARRIDYSANDYERFTGGAFLQFLTDDWQYDVVAASQSKEFGAQGYYGQPSDIYAEQLIDDGLFFAGATKGDLDDAFMRASAYYRDVQDQYLVPSTLFQRDVTARNAAVAVEGRTMEIQHLALALRGDLEHDRISGDVQNDDRTRGSVLILPEARFEYFTFKAGLNTAFQTSESADFLPVLGIDWFVTDNGRIFFSYTETEQQPDFQTLGSNPDLQQQLSHNTELGFKQFLSESCDWRISSFFRTLENASDWIAGSATDLGRLNVAGIDTAISYYPSEQLELKAYYQWIHKDNEIEDGLYETDYPEHMLNLSVYWNFLADFTVQFAQTTRWQAENALRTSDDFGAEASLGLHYVPRFANNVRLSFLVDNLWGTNFQAIPGLKPRPTTVFTGVAVGW